MDTAYTDLKYRTYGSLPTNREYLLKAPLPTYCKMAIMNGCIYRCVRPILWVWISDLMGVGVSVIFYLQVKSAPAL
jgi:hypothetical protein